MQAPVSWIAADPVKRRKPGSSMGRPCSAISPLGNCFAPWQLLRGSAVPPSRSLGLGCPSGRVDVPVFYQWSSGQKYKKPSDYPFFPAAIIRFFHLSGAGMPSIHFCVFSLLKAAACLSLAFNGGSSSFEGVVPSKARFFCSTNKLHTKVSSRPCLCLLQPGSRHRQDLRRALFHFRPRKFLYSVAPC